MGLLRRTIPITHCDPICAGNPRQNPMTPIRRMRDIFEDIFENQPLDPMESARRNMRPNLRARFYKDASVGDQEGEGGFAVLLDGRPVRSPARKLLAAPRRELAQAIAAEWQAQEKVIDPAAMPLTRLANSIIDWRDPAPQRLRRTSRSISAPTCCSIARRSRKVWSRCSGSIGIR